VASGIDAKCRSDSQLAVWDANVRLASFEREGGLAAASID
jgi:hypothetical protein